MFNFFKFFNFFLFAQKKSGTIKGQRMEGGTEPLQIKICTALCEKIQREQIVRYRSVIFLIPAYRNKDIGVM